LPGAARTATRAGLRAARLPAARLHSKLNLDEIDWTPVRDLLDSGATDAHFVAEVEDDGTARLRFGDDRLGARPEALSAFDANTGFWQRRRGHMSGPKRSRICLPTMPRSRGDPAGGGNPLPADGA